MLFVTHHLGVVASLCDDVVVMHRGEVKEQGTVAEVFGNPQDPYTKMLLRCDPAWIEEKTRHLPITSDDPDAPIVIETGPPDRIKTSEPPVLKISGLDVTFSKKAFLGVLASRYGPSRGRASSCTKGRPWRSSARAGPVRPPSPAR
jgi:ABC-type glutathione transport system ATPase component